MDKVANRALRRMMDLFAGKRIPMRNVPIGVKDLSKPMWSRYGFETQDDMLDAYRKAKRDSGYLPLGGDGADEFLNTDFSITGNIRSYLNRLLGRAEAPKPSRFQESSKMSNSERRILYRNLRGSIQPEDSLPFSTQVGQYISRRLKNDTNLKYLNTLSRRHRFLNHSRTTEPMNSAVGYSFNLDEPRHIRYGDYGLYDAKMPRLKIKLGSLARRGFLGPVDEREHVVTNILSQVLPATGLTPNVGPPKLPLLVSFQARGPFGTTNHVHNAEVTQSRMQEVDKAVEKLKHHGITPTADNISSEVYKTNDPAGLRVHAGEPYTPDEIQEMRTGYFGNRINNNYESVFSIGDPRYPVPVTRYVGGSPAVRLRAQSVGLSPIFDRKPRTAEGMIPDNDLIEFKGTEMPMPANVKWKTPVEGESTVADRISSAYEDALQSHLNARYDRPRTSNSYVYNHAASEPTVLGTVLDLPGANKYPVGEKTWLTPNPVTASGYGRGAEFFPVTDSELRKLLDPDAATTFIDPVAELNALPADKQKLIADIVAHYGNYAQTQRFTDVANKNIAQMNAMVPRIAKSSTPRSFIDLLLNGSERANIPLNVGAFHNPDTYIPLQEVLNKVLKRI